MKKYFIHVIWGVLLKPRNAIEYAINNSNPLYLTILIIVGIGSGTHGTLFIKSLFISHYINDMLMEITLFGVIVLLIYIFSKILQIKTSIKNISFVTLLMSLASMWVSLLTFIVIAIIGILDDKLELISVNGGLFAVGFILLLVLSFMYFFYILVQLLNQVQKGPLWKSVVIVALSNLALLIIFGVSKYFEKEQQMIVVSIYQTLIKNTNDNSKKSKYYMHITDLYEDQEEYEEAIKYYFKALKIEENNITRSEHYYWIAEDYREIGKIDDALTYAKKSLSITPDDEDSIEQVSELKNIKLDM